MTYYLDGQVKTRTDQAGLVLTYSYDSLRRKIGEQVTDWNNGPADDTVQSLGTDYDGLGRVEKVTAYGANALVLNQVQYAFDDMGRLKREYQAHTGEVDPDTTPYVEYTYYAPLNGTVYDKCLRLVSTRYPNGRIVHATYGSSGTVPDALSQLAAFNENDGGTPGNPLAQFAYNGIARMVKETHLAGGTAVMSLDYTSSSGGAAAPYPGIDRYGRIAWQTWKKSDGTPLDRYFYGYDNASNRIWRGERTNLTGLAGRDEAYAYDGLGRLTKAVRGILGNGGSGGSPICPIAGDCAGSGGVPNGQVDSSDQSVWSYWSGDPGSWFQGDFNGDGIVNSTDATLGTDNLNLNTRSVSRTWQWSLDSVGNPGRASLPWLDRWTEYREDAGDGTAWDLVQARSHNKANEIDTNDVHSDTPGNAIAASQGDNWIDPKYDAAGNMSQAPVPGAETTRQHYKFDAWNRLVEVRADSTGTPGTPGAIVATYRHDATGRRIRKLLGTDPVTALDYYHNSGGQIIEVRKGGSEYPLEQYLWSPRYVHAPVMRWRDGNTDGDLEDEGDSTLYYCNDANMNVTALVNTSGTVVERYLYEPYGKVTIYDGSWANPSSTSAVSNEVLFTGHRLDPESGLYTTLYRPYHPTLGDWTGRDPKGYVDGMRLYEYVGSCPLSRMDAMGLEKSLSEAAWDAFRSMWTSNESPTERRKSLARDYEAAAPEPVFVVRVDPNASKVTQFQQKIAAVPVAGNLTSAYNEHAYRNNDVAAQGYLLNAAADACFVLGSGAGGAAAGVRATANVVAATRSAAASKTAAPAAPAEAAEGMAPKPVSTPVSGADMPAGSLRGPAKPTSAPVEGPAAAPTTEPVLQGCFPAGTLIDAGEGPKPIETVCEGEEVWACNPETGRWELKPVVMPMTQHYAGDIVNLTVGDESIEATGNHPFWVVAGPGLAERHPACDVYEQERGLTKKGRWVEARSLCVGDVLCLRNGADATILALSTRHGSMAVYNIVVDGLHTYAVGSSGILVHNKPVRAASGEEGGFVKMPKGDNTAQNKAFAEACRRLGIAGDKTKMQSLHREITKQNMSIDDIVKTGESLFGGSTK
ncbi:MAG: polymorphic toxin-type HINT domain-containing protein [Planctomycetota bacterium]|nr:polymorphic toxin-type HINT domain-containing protein [Planctomycetota bacterium]